MPSFKRRQFFCSGRVALAATFVVPSSPAPATASLNLCRESTAFHSVHRIRYQTCDHGVRANMLWTTPRSRPDRRSGTALSKRQRAGKTTPERRRQALSYSPMLLSERARFVADVGSAASDGRNATNSRRSVRPCGIEPISYWRAPDERYQNSHARTKPFGRGRDAQWCTT